MKKSAVVLAVAAAITASASVHAETTFYGRIAAVLQRVDPDNGEDAWDVGDSGSRWGVKASEDLGNGLSVLLQLETAINADRHENARNFDGRLAYVGLEGGFGKFTIGSIWSPYYDAMGVADIFNEAGWYSLYSGPFRVRNSVRYDTPSMGGFNASVLLNVDNDSAGDAGETGTPLGQVNEDGVDQYHVGLRYSGGPFFIGAGYLGNEETNDSQYGASASFDIAGVSIAAMYEHFDADANDADTDAAYLTAQYKFANNILKAGYGRIDPDQGDERDEWAVGIQHNLSKSSRVWIEYADEDENGNLLTIGLRKDW